MYESSSSDQSVAELKDRIVEMQTMCKMWFRVKDRQPKEIDFNSNEGIFYRSDA
jgi:hypothetical protein